MPTPAPTRPLSVAFPLTLLALLAGCAAARPAPAAEGTARLTLISTNDLHGWVEPRQSRLPDGRVVRSGGLATFAGYLARLRAENPGGVVLVDAGDLFQGTLVANLSEGAVVVDAYNALGYDLAAIGNHEFDYGPLGPRSAAIDPADDPLGALAARAAQARFPLLARNVYLPDGSRPAFLRDGTALLERHGVKIGLVALLTPLTPQVTNPVNVAGLRFTPLAEEANSAAAELRRRGAEVLVAVVHAGGRCARPADPASCERGDEIFQFLDALPEGLFDAVLTAHSHTKLGLVVRGMPVLQSQSYGSHFGLIELEFDRAARRVRREATRIQAAIPVCERVFPGTDSCDAKRPTPGELVPATFRGGPILPDPAISRVIAPHLERVEKEQRRSLGVEVPAALPRDSHGESPLGDALADAVRAMEGSDVALLNSGGLRADLAQGTLTYGQLYEVFPFDNSIATLRLTGDEIARLLETLLSSSHGAPQISGLRVRVARCGPQARVVELLGADGRPLDRAATYRLTTSDFLALGGDGLGKVLDAVPAERKDFGHRRPLNMRDALAEWLARRGGALEAKVDGRLGLDAPCPAP